MTTLTGKKGLQVLTSATGAGGAAINDNFIELADRWGDVYITKANGTVQAYPASTDTDAARGVSIETALAAAVAGDLITVRPGGYSITSNILKDQVNWYFQQGAVVTRTSTTIPTNNEAIFDDKGLQIVCSIDGLGQFIRDTTAWVPFENEDTVNVSVLAMENVNSVIHFTCDKLTVTDDAGPTGLSSISCIAQFGGKLFLRCNEIASDSYGFWWTDGEGYYDCPRIQASLYTIYATSGGTTLHGILKPYTSGFMWVTTKDVLGTIACIGENAARVWIIGLKVINTTGFPAIDTAGPFLYVNFQEARGGIRIRGDGTTDEGGVLWARIQKVTAGDTVFPVIDFDDGGFGALRSWLFLQHIENPTDIQTNVMIRCKAGTHYVSGQLLETGTTANGVEVTGGKLHLADFKIDNSASTTKNPIFLSTDDALIVKNISLVSNGARECIIPILDSEDLIKSYKSLGVTYGNNAINANVETKIGSYVEDSDVE